MNRLEAIRRVLELRDPTVDGAVLAEITAEEQETREALRALGVTDAEIDEAEEA